MRLAVAQLRGLPPNVRGALWLVSGGFIFTCNGVMIRLLTQRSHIRMQIDVEAARRDNLTISSKLLRPAEIVNSGAG